MKNRLSQISATISVVILFHSTTCLAKDKIEWTIMHWPPIMTMDESRTNVTGGQLGEQLKLLQNALPDYSHTNTHMIWNRFWTSMKTGAHAMNIMALKTQERLEYAEFSLPTNIILPNQLIMRKETSIALGNPKSLSLTELLQNRQLKGMLLAKRSYGVEIDGVLAQYEGKSSISRSATNDENNISKLLDKRGDYIIEYPFVANHLLDKNHPKSKGELVNIAIKEAPLFTFGYIAGPKNEWGRAAMIDINKALKKLVPSKEFRKLFELMYTKEQLPIVLEYNDKYLIPAVMGEQNVHKE